MCTEIIMFIYYTVELKTKTPERKEKLVNDALPELGRVQRGGRTRWSGEHDNGHENAVRTNKI